MLSIRIPHTQLILHHLRAQPDPAGIVQLPESHVASHKPVELDTQLAEQ
jgi:hypothetical protein